MDHDRVMSHTVVLEGTMKANNYQRSFRGRTTSKSLQQFVIIFVCSCWIGFQIQCSTSSIGVSNSNLEGLIPNENERNMNYNLAYQQSYGFFENIPNEEWELRQEWARNATFQRYVGHPKRQWDKPNLWYYNNYDPLFSCPMRKRVRGIGDGPKWTCNPQRLRSLAIQRRNSGQSGPYIVYSTQLGPTETINGKMACFWN